MLRISPRLSHASSTKCPLWNSMGRRNETMDPQSACKNSASIDGRLQKTPSEHYFCCLSCSWDLYFARLPSSGALLPRISTLLVSLALCTDFIMLLFHMSVIYMIRQHCIFRNHVGSKGLCQNGPPKRLCQIPSLQTNNYLLCFLGSLLCSYSLLRRFTFLGPLLCSCPSLCAQISCSKIFRWIP